MHDIFKHLIIFHSNIKKHNQTHIVVLFLMSAVKSVAETAIGKHTV